MSARFRGICVALLSVFLSATYSIFSKHLLQHAIPETLLLVVQVFSILAVLFFFGLIPELKNIRHLHKDKLGFLVLIGLLSGVLGPLFFMKGLLMTTAINAIVTSKLSSIFLGILSFIFVGDRFTWKWLIGVTIMFLGIAYITTAGFSLGFSVDSGIFLVACSAFFYAVGSIIYKKYMSDIKPEVVILFRNVVAAIVFILAVPAILGVTHNVSWDVSSDVLLYFVGLAFFAVFLSLYLRYESLDHLPASTVGSINLLSPLFGMVMASVFLQEELFVYHGWGSLMMVGGLFITMLKPASLTYMKNILIFKRHH